MGSMPEWLQNQMLIRNAAYAAVINDRLNSLQRYLSDKINPDDYSVMVSIILDVKDAAEQMRRAL